MASRLAVVFEDYEAYHRTPGNKLCHYVGIPLVACTLVGLLSTRQGKASSAAVPSPAPAPG